VKAKVTCSMAGCDRPAVKRVDEIPLCREHVTFWTKPGAFNASKLPAAVTKKS
jgi:hypothetical protein